MKRPPNISDEDYIRFLEDALATSIHPCDLPKYLEKMPVQATRNFTKEDLENVMDYSHKAFPDE